MKNIGHIWHKEAEIITRSPRTRKNTPRQLKYTMKLIKKRLINILRRREKVIKLNLLFLNWNP
jgi:hypothetical protein